MTIKIFQIDTFTDTIFRGSPAAVCPLETWLPDDVMQKIAFENNLPESLGLIIKFHITLSESTLTAKPNGLKTLKKAFKRLLSRFVQWPGADCSFCKTLNIPAIIVPAVNPDNNQHGPNESIRHSNYINGVKTIMDGYFNTKNPIIILFITPQKIVV